MSAKSGVTNDEIFAALQAMGYAPDMGPVDPRQMVGNQHGEFMQRMMANFKINDETFAKAEEAARRLKAGAASKGGLHAGDVTAIIQNIDKDAPSLKAGIDVDPVSGRITVRKPQEPTFAPQSGPAAPARPAPATPTGPGGVTMGTTKSRATPGVAAPTGAVTGGGGGGGGGTTVNPAANAGPAPPPALAKNATEEEIQKHVKQYYGFMSWGLDIPEIRDIVKDIAENPNTKWTQDAINGRVQQTGWWQANGINVQTWLQRRANDPGQTQKEIKDKFDDFKATAKAGGIDIPDQRLWDMAEEALKWKWSEATIQATLGAEYRFDPSKPTAQTQNIKKMASDYLVPMSDEATGYWTTQILTGQKTEDEYKQHLIQQAKSMFPQLAAPLDRGEPLTVYLDSYKQRAAQLLEQDPDNINLMDTKYLRLLTRTDPKTGERSMMDLADMEQVIRTDPQYGYEYTKGARDEASSLASTLMKKMGVIA